MRYVLPALVLALSAAACTSSSSYTAPSPTPPAPAPPSVPPVANTFMLSGRVISTTTGSAVASASVSVADGVNAGRATTTDTRGNYTMPGLTASAFTLSISALAYVPTTRSVSLSANATTDVALLPINMYELNSTTSTN